MFLIVLPTLYLESHLTTYSFKAFAMTLGIGDHHADAAVSIVVTAVESGVCFGPD